MHFSSIVIGLAFPATLYCIKRFFSIELPCRKKKLLSSNRYKDLELREKISSKVDEAAITRIEEIQTNSRGKRTQNPKFDTIDSYSCKLPPLSIDKHVVIYDYLDDCSKARYRRISRSIHRFFTFEEPHLSKIEKFILENYSIIGGYPIKTNIKKFLTSPPYILCLGESHTIPGHTVVNAFAGNLLFTSHTNYLVEGGESSIAIWKEQRSDMFKYFKPEIIKRVKSWDIDPEDETRKGFDEKRLKFIKLNIFVFQKLFELYLEKEKWTFESFCIFLEKRFDAALVERFWSELNPNLKSSSPKQSQELLCAQCQVSPLYREYTMTFLKIMTIGFVFKVIRPKILELNKEDEEITSLRDSKLELHTLEIRKTWESGIVFAGSYHIQKLHECYKKMEFKKNNHYLCLTPLDTISEKSVKMSYSHIFSHSGLHAPLQTLAPSLEKSSTCSTVLESPLSKSISSKSLKEYELTLSNECDLTLSLEEQIKRFIAFDSNDVDYGVNHFGLWQKRMGDLCDAEMKELQLRFNYLTTELEKSNTFSKMIDELGTDGMSVLREQGFKEKETEIIIDYL